MNALEISLDIWPSPVNLLKWPVVSLPHPSWNLSLNHNFFMELHTLLCLIEKLPPSPPLCSSKSHKYSNYNNAPYIVSSWTQYPQADVFNRLFTWPTGWTDSPTIRQHTIKQLLNCTFSRSRTGLTIGKLNMTGPLKPLNYQT